MVKHSWRNHWKSNRVCDLLYIFKITWLCSFKEIFMMSGSQQIQVLADCRYLLRFMNLGSTIELKIRRWKIPNNLLFTLLLMPSIFCFVCEILNMLEMNLDFYEDSNSFIFLLISIQFPMIYMCLIQTNGVIIKTLDHMQRIVERSNC